MKNPFELSWGPVTPEFSSDERNEAIHVLNHNIETPTLRERTLHFLSGRIKWYTTQLPDGMRQRAILDDRGQRINPSDRAQIVSGLKKVDCEVEFMSAKEK